jgi:nicotinamidase-related amidase
MTRSRFLILGSVLACFLGAAAVAQTASGPMMTIQMPAAPAPVAVTVKPATTALFVSDMIDPICKNQAGCTGQMVPAVAKLLAGARQAGMLVVYSTQEANMQKWLPEVKPAAGDPLIPSHGQDRFFDTDLDKVLKAKGITTVILTGWKISGSILYTSVGATLRGYTVVVPADASLAPNDHEQAIGTYMILNQNAANATNEPLKAKTSTISRTDLITIQ